MRVIEQTLSALHRYRRAFNLRTHPLFGFQMISHKVLRYGVPFFLIAIFLSNLLLVGSSEIYNLAFVGQAIFYLTAIMGRICDWFELRIGPLGFPYYFALANVASLVAFLKFMRGEAHVAMGANTRNRLNERLTSEDAKSD